MTPSDIRVLVVDDHPVVLTGLCIMLQYEPGMEAVGEAKDGLEAVQQFRHLQPDVTLMDLQLPGMSGREAIVAILQEFPPARIIILTTYDGDEDIYRGLHAGAKGYLLKDAPRHELIEAIRVVHSGRNYIPVQIGAKLAERMSRPQLSDRERQVLRLMAEGNTNQAIATELYLSEGTVKFHITNILSKLQVRDRTQAVLIALKRGIANL